MYVISVPLFLTLLFVKHNERAKVRSDWAMMHAVQGQMAPDNAIIDQSARSPSLPSAQDDQAAHLFLLDPGGEK